LEQLKNKNCCYHRAAAMRGNEKVGSSLRFITFVSGDTFVAVYPAQQQPVTVTLCKNSYMLKIIFEIIEKTKK